MVRFYCSVFLGALSLLVLPVDGAMAAPLTIIEPSPPAEETAISRDSFDLVSISQQVQSLLQTARTINNSGDAATALVQIDQAVALVQLLPIGEERDRLLAPTGSYLIELKALDQALAIAQAMTDDTYGNTGNLRTQLEVALTKAYIQTGQTPQAVQLIQSLNLDGRDFYWMVAVEALANQGDVEEAVNLFENVKDKDNLLFTDVDGNAITHAYIGAGQFAAAQNFLAQHPISDPY
ncbi:MAG: hypothetical protein DCF25_18610 [Leptolyngbya foveolarum]|uniref:Uncharacterized protein n=1 Tax=Leptolyngbya foveolarum TaxID=47253 RepID=A0A2W4TY90_9CYAN|nr:MAG: hypothetical protein DCF25_18610 [Leptolyngbya foveolarum]